MTITLNQFCDIYSVSQRDRIASIKFFGASGQHEATEEEWNRLFTGNFALGKAWSQQDLKSLLVKSLEDLREIARTAGYPEADWANLDTKAKLANYINNNNK
jgi:hypothetical protein